MSVSICDTKCICEHCVAERSKMRNIECFVRVRTNWRPSSTVKSLCVLMTTNVTCWTMVCRLWRTVTQTCRMNKRLYVRFVLSFRIMDVRLKHPFTCTMAGPTCSGKTWFVFRLITNANRVVDPPPKKVVYCYGEFQPSFTEFPEIDFHEELPDVG
jgi:hypothetical protein